MVDLLPLASTRSMAETHEDPDSCLLCFTMPLGLGFIFWTGLVYQQSHEFHPQGTNQLGESTER
jgi:hypothetical protein